MINFWREWFGDVGRGVGNPKRDFIATSADFVKGIQANEKAGKCSYARVQPFCAYETSHCLTCAFYDFDCVEDPEKAGADAFDFAQRLDRFYGIEALISFSGNKGYHIRVFTETPFGVAMGKGELKAVYGRFQRMLLGNEEYKTLDPSVLGDISQLARIPYTTHEKTGKLCRPIDIKPLEQYLEKGISFDLC